ncbi:hypothetical protein ACLB2K_062777 [Fragaria x ananassa]
MVDTDDVLDESWLCSTDHLYTVDESLHDDSENEAVCGLEHSPSGSIGVPKYEFVGPVNSSGVALSATEIDLSNDLIDDIVLNKGEPSTVDKFNRFNIRDITYDDVSDLLFEDYEAAGKFYNYYAHVRGFSTRKSKMYRHRTSDFVYRREWECSKAGVNPKKRRNPVEVAEKKRPVDIKETKRRNHMLRRGYRQTRCSCTAKFVVKWCLRRKKYFVWEFVTLHNHDLCRPNEVHFLRSHRKVEDHDLAQVQSLNEVQVPISRAYEFLSYQAGGYNNMRFMLKDLYNKLGRKNITDNAEGDAQTAVRSLRARSARETEFFFEHTVDTEGRLKNMFWRDHQSLLDYTAYGDVLIIDSTYKTNRYRQPLVLFVGCNNHRATTVFGFALVGDEKEETYDWVFNMFLVSMKYKKPMSVITDGDEAIKSVLERLMPEARHRLCAWHIGRNIGQNLNNVEAIKCFSKFIYASLTVPEWEAQWREAVEMHQMENNEWVTALYKKRTRWAESFFRGSFYGGMCSTQRCEGMNCQFKKRLDPSTTVSAVYGRLEWKQRRIRDRAQLDNFKVRNSTPVFDTHMRKLEVEACKTFSHDIFIMIKSQINFGDRFVVHQRFPFPNADAIVFYVGQYDKVERRWSVDYCGNKGNPQWSCSCKMYESDGIPCAHLFCVFKYELIIEFPTCLINKRWTREVGETTILPSCVQVENTLLATSARYASLLIEAGKACSRYAESPEGFNAAMIELEKLNKCSMKYNPTVNEDHAALYESDSVVGDPLKCRTKGMPSKTEQKRSVITCSNCEGLGHNTRSCKKPRLVPDVCGSGNVVGRQTPALDNSRDWEPCIPRFSPAIQ